MDKFEPAPPVPEGVPDGQVAAFKVSADYPPGPYAPDLIDRVARELSGYWLSTRLFGRKTACYEAAKKLLHGEPVMVPLDGLYASKEPLTSHTILVPRLPRDRGPAVH